MSVAPRTGSLVIDNVTGSNALSVNGVYEPTPELCDGLPVFQKKGNGDIWLEYFNSKWRIRVTTNRRTTSQTASVIANRPCLPQDCNIREWQVAEGDIFVSDPRIAVFSLAIDEYFVPIVLLIRRGVINRFVGRSIIFNLLGLRQVIGDLFNLILFKQL